MQHQVSTGKRSPDTKRTLAQWTVTLLCFLMILLLAFPAYAESLTNTLQPQSSKNEAIVFSDEPVALADSFQSQTAETGTFGETNSELLVRFQPGAARNIAAMNAVHQHVGASVKRYYHLVKGLQLVQLKQGLSAAEGLQRYRNNPNVLYAEPVYQLHALGIPNDPDFSALWGLHNTGQTIQSQTGTTGADISAVQAWQLETGSSDIIVAVVDTGVDYTHPDLTGNMWISGEGYYGKNFIAEASDPNNPMDDRGHGTHVAGTIAAVGNNQTGITGVMQEARIMALKVLDKSGSGNTALLIDAIQYADDNNAHVINLSLGGGNYSQAVRDAMAASQAVIVAAAGNNGTDNDNTPFYPAGYGLPHLISVAASDNRNQLADFSNYGATSVHVAGPGVGIYSTVSVPDYNSSVTLFEDGFEQLSHWNTNWNSENFTHYPWTRTADRAATGSYSAAYRVPQNEVYDTLEKAYLNLAGTIDLRNVQAAQLAFNLSSDLSYNLPDPSAELYLRIWCDAMSEEPHTLVLKPPTSNEFYYGTVDLNYFAGQMIDQISFEIIADDAAYIGNGAFIDDVKISTVEELVHGYSYKGGTSMAAPHVSGLAGLVLSARPDLTPVEVVNQLKDNVDLLSSLHGKVSSGGRINAFSTLLAGFLQTLDWEQWAQPLTGPPSKLWTIQFNQAVDPALLDQQIFVTLAGTFTPIDGVVFQVTPEDASEILMNRADGWLPGQYHLYISNKVSSIAGDPLAQVILAQFEIH